ncbi:hypothetical protein PFISCL1PPCAC_22416, partial [Pristionchus fissidentatus]
RSMRNLHIFLLLIVLPSAKSGLNWEDCSSSIATTVCLAYFPELDQYADYHPKLHKNVSEDMALIIRPDTKAVWNFTITHPRKTKTNQLDFEFNQNSKISCIKSQVEWQGGEEKVDIIAPFSEDKMCSFTLSMKNKTETLDGYLSTIGKSFKIGIEGQKMVDSFEYFSFGSVNDKLACKKFDLPACGQDEACLQIEQNFECPADFHTMYRERADSNFTKIASIFCSGGDVKIAADQTLSYFPEESVAKCARKRCSLCKFHVNKTNSVTPKYTPSDAFDRCTKLECENGFMVINSNMATSEGVECSSSSIDETNAKWEVEGQLIKIATAECKKRVPCENLTKIVPAPCGENGEAETEDCHKPIVNPDTLTFECKSGQEMQLVAVNQTGAPIDPPVCEANGTWLVTFHEVDATTQKAVNRTEAMTSIDELRIKCIDLPVSASLVEGSSSSLLIGLVIGIICLVVIVFGIIVFVVVKRRKAQTASLSVPQTSSNTKTSKASSAELEPLTSALVSVSGDSVEAKKEKKPIVLADVRGVTAAAGKSGEKKEEESDNP